MPERRVLPVRLSDEGTAAIDSLATKYETTRSEVVRAILRHAFADGSADSAVRIDKRDGRIRSGPRLVPRIRKS